MSAPVARRRGRPASADRHRALEHAVAAFARGERIELRRIAEELGVSRSSVHLWFGTRESLLALVLMEHCRPMWMAAVAASGDTGGQRVLDVLDRYNRRLARDAAAMAFFTAQRALAHRVMTSRDSRVHRGMLTAVHDLIETEVAAGTYVPPMETWGLARALVRLGEAFLLLDVLDDQVDVDAMRATQRVVLGLPRDADIRVGSAGSSPSTM